ncbi:DNA adenine methylase [Xanthomonas campestris pv. trichodesmae]|uniref:site-specific DNA-methyltransferase (adenine-specific) n=2 Tax=Xanthomonas citri TaxID=346 RepID=A0AB33CAI6_XANCI|nr:DNA adenine methylase [Xanthomonas citri]MBV6782229.1 DNA adenine methylase [Xanthomonas campestris pv. trichodesmae]OOW88530.1 restriction endonuclease subunit M [Xanthomonas campestris pv. vitistrifoliae]ASK90543.1 restriction endonuclease subunit M [Xanthomonas citri pv. vignicola]MBZ3921913.1 restriction endonuclease subunit M [Xanthomonas campestris pv. trichodesmae]MBZ3926577.1 restriction endonuclease subunit M [Xanthomonas citri pv. sesbaniae]
MTRPMIPWPGGKRRLIKHLYPHFPAHETYVEAFAGGAAALLMRPRPAPLEVLNDINSDLVCLYRCVRHHLDEFVRMFRWSLVSREMFEWAQMERPETLTDIQRAARFYYLQKLSFGGKVEGQTFGLVASGAGPRLNLLRIEEELSAVHLRLANVIIERLPWYECVTRYDRPETLFYLDPPYWQTEGYGVKFPFSEYERIAELMRSCSGKILVSLNDHPDVRAIFRDCQCIPLQLNYTIGGVDSREKRFGELIIKSWDDSVATLF